MTYFRKDRLEYQGEFLGLPIFQSPIYPKTGYIWIYMEQGKEESKAGSYK